jgi:ATP-dependent DNA helicase RecG
MAFVDKHLNEPFYLEGTERISLRDRIFRELVSNLIAHREYTSAAPATLTIFRDKVVFRNPHVPHLRGRIDPKRFTPFPKNPTICRFMLQMGRYEQVGSGVYNVTKYLPLYSPGASPVFEEYADVFETIIPLASSESGRAPHVTPQVTGEVTGEVAGEVTGEVLRLLRACAEDLPRQALQSRVGIKHDEHFRLAYMRPALDAALIEMTIPDKPRSRLQKYRLTAKGRTLIAKANNNAEN